MSIYGSVWSREYIDAHPIPVVPRELLPWLKKDRDNGVGLKKAEQSLRAAKRALVDATDPKVIEFLQIQEASAAGKVAFYAGKIYLLDKVIASVT